ncbi:PTS fructose transporter subunit IIABC [Faecalibacterium prausnitzii]|uniref:PTS fructose transporter subunit IIABC n=1 Tax=Faecalibacterium prausnitzii TaxID=853 RepID=UPI003C2B59AA
MRITSLFSLNAIALDVAASNQDEIIDKVVELQSTHNNILDKEAYKKALYAREEEGSTYVDNGITVPHAKANVVTRPSLAALRLSSPVQYNAEDDGTTDLLFAIAAPENGSLHVDMLARMMQMLMNEEFVEQLRTAKTPQAFLDAIDKQEEAQFGNESFTDQSIPQDGFRVLAVTACPNGIAHTYMAAEALTKAGTKLELPVKVETNGSDGAKNILTREEIAACDGIIVAAEKKVETARFDGKPVLFTRVDDGIHKPEELIKKIVHGEVPIYHSKDKAAGDAPGASDSAAHTVYKNLMNGVSHMLPFVVGGGIMIALAFLLDDYTIDPSNFGMNTPVAAFFKTVGSAAFGYMLPILSAFIAMSIADRPGLAVGFVGGVLAMNGTNFAGIAAGETTGVSGGFLAALLAGFVAGYVVEFLKKITEKLPASLNGIRPMLIYPLGGMLILGAVMCGINPVMGMINTAMTDCLNAMGGTSKVLLGAIVAGMMSIDMGGPFNKAAYVFGTAALASGNYEVMAAVMVGGMVPPIAIALSTTFCPKKWTADERRNGIVNYVMGLCFVTEGAIPYAAADPLRVLPSCVAGAAVAGALSMTFGCALRAPHGGIFVFPVVDHALMYVVALAAGSIVGAVILSLLKKTRTE